MARPTVAIVDYETGNVGSVVNMLRKIGAVPRLTRQVSDFRDADRLILPGVGAFDRGMENLHKFDLVGPLSELVLEQGKPLLGICLGMQLITQASEEGSSPGLGWIDAACRRFTCDGDAELRVPNMGWREVQLPRASTLFPDPAGEHRYYFVHSYHVVCQEADQVIAVSTHGTTFTAGFAAGNVYGVQFHPEKSHRYGMDLLRSYVGLDRT